MCDKTKCPVNYLKFDACEATCKPCEADIDLEQLEIDIVDFRTEQMIDYSKR